MDFSYTPAQADLQRARRRTPSCSCPHEEAVELSGGQLAEEIQRELEQRCDATLGLWAMNMPTELGRRRAVGARAGHRAGADRRRRTACGTSPGGRPTCWRTARPEQQEEYLLPVIRGERRDCFAVTEPDAGSDAGNVKTTATQGRRRLADQRREVVRHRAATSPTSSSCTPTRGRTRCRRCSWSTRARRASRSCTRRSSCTPRCSATRRSASPTCSSPTTRCSARSGRATT